MKLLSIFALSLLASSAFAACDENADKLLKAYPEQLAACEDNYIVWHDGHRQLFDDGLEKDFETLLNQPDLEDMFKFPYPVGADSYAEPAFNVDPGRIRNEEFFRCIYGDSKQEVKRQLVAVKWMPESGGKKVYVTGINGIDKKLAAVSAELDKLPTELKKKYLLKTSGTFNWRVISGTQRLSAHSFAIAIDINAQKANYWKWAGKNYRYQNNIPHEIVEIFEKHGFIWGGKWYHYDTMHFEYRPELL